jgi:hypothetical protein
MDAQSTNKERPHTNTDYLPAWVTLPINSLCPLETTKQRRASFTWVLGCGFGLCQRSWGSFALCFCPFLLKLKFGFFVLLQRINRELRRIHVGFFRRREKKIFFLWCLLTSYSIQVIARVREWARIRCSLIPWHIVSHCMQISEWGAHLVHSCKEINLRCKGREGSGKAVTGQQLWEAARVAKHRRFARCCLHKACSPSSTTRTSWYTLGRAGGPRSRYFFFAQVVWRGQDINREGSERGKRVFSCSKQRRLLPSQPSLQVLSK